MNEFERTLLDVIGFTDYIAAFAQPNRQIALIDNYGYSVDYTSAAAPVNDATVRTFNIVMDTDSDFILTQVSGAALVPNDPINPTGVTFLRYNPAILVQITDNYSQKTWFNIPTLLPLIAGAGGFPFILPSPRIIPPRTTVTVTAQGAGSGEVFPSFFLTLNGSRIFYR